MPTKSHKPFLLVAAGLLALASVACGTTQTLDDEDLELTIGDILRSRAGATVNSIDCPADRPLRANDVFNCTADTDLGVLTIQVTQTDDKGNISWTVI
jgi:hypothetical protein